MPSTLARALLGALAAAVLAPATLPAAQLWTVESGVVTVSLEDAVLAGLGLSVATVRTTAAPDPGAGLEGTLHAFALENGAPARFHTEAGAFRAMEAEAGGLTVRGGLALATGGAAPVYVLDFAIELDADPDGSRLARLRTADPHVPVPLEIHSAGVRFEPRHGRMSVTGADLRITAALAGRLGRPELAGAWIGGISLALRASTPDRADAPAPDPHGPAPDTGIDVRLAQLYGIAGLGHDGTYPNGRAGFSAATTCCNVGSVTVPWNAPMAATHPFVTLAMYRRDAAGTLEMIGTSWMKHGFNALAQSVCAPCGGPGGSSLAVGCSDTYSVSNNGSRFYLGPREEVNPYTATWEPCGSFFDGTPADCQRSYLGNESSCVAHRLEVGDADLERPGATFLYEAQYVVAGDDDPWNNIGWRGLLPSWNGFGWNTTTTGGGLAASPGAAIGTFGDVRDTVNVAYGDGEVILASRVTDLGGGTWHYEYALFNFRSDRAVRMFRIPVGTAGVTNAGFHDPDGSAANDWTAVVAGGNVTWSTADWATNPSANALRHGRMFNFRFDAAAAPGNGTATGGIFKPGPGTTFGMAARVPVAARAAQATGEEPELRLLSPRRVRFSAGRAAAARIAVYDVAGRMVRILWDGPVGRAGTELTWDGRDSSGAAVASGVYFFRLEADGALRTERTTLIR